METCKFAASHSRTRVDRLVDSWRRTRRAAHEGLTKIAVRSYHTLLRKEGIILASGLLASPRAHDLEKHFQRTTASVTMSMLYDYPTLETENDKTLTEIRAFIDRMSTAAVPGASLVEVFPWMMYIPERFVLTFMRCFFRSVLWFCVRFARWKSNGRRHFVQHNAMFQTLLDRARNDVVRT